MGPAYEGALIAAIVLVLAASTAAVSAVSSNLILAIEKSNIDLYANLAGAGFSIAVGLPLAVGSGSWAQSQRAS